MRNAAFSTQTLHYLTAPRKELLQQLLVSIETFMAEQAEVAKLVSVQSLCRTALAVRQARRIKREMDRPYVNMCQELIRAERSYNATLNALVENYMLPLQRLLSNDAVSTDANHALLLYSSSPLPVCVCVCVCVCLPPNSSVISLFMTIDGVDMCLCRTSKMRCED